MNTSSMHRRACGKWVENDVTSRKARRLLCFLHRAGETAYWKNYINRRERRQGRAAVRAVPGRRASDG